MSSTASVHSAKEVHPAERAQPVEIVDEYEDAEKNFQPKSLRFWTIIVGVYLSIFLVALDRTIVATAIPRITDDFNSVQDIGWYGSSYMLTAACFIPISGRIYQLYPTKWVFVLSIVIFEAGSALRSIVPSDQLQVVIHAYSHALTRVFILTAALSACMSLGALAVEWKKIKGKSETRGPSKSPDTEFEDSKSDVKP